MPVEIRYDRFLVAGAPAGALVRHLEPGRLRTVLAYASADGAVVHHTSEIDHPGDVRHWTRSRYTETEKGLDVEHRHLGSAAPSVPTYADVLVVERLARLREDRLDVPVLHERDGDVEAGAFVRHARDLAAPRGLQVDSRVDVLTGVALHARHWCLGPTLLASDWMGAFSFRVRTLDLALRGVPDGVAALVRDAVR
ncbi:hypothetical protein FH969_11165 [Miniimonas arenae]|uniref:Uncharacterized protein n=1 Tax=Miniimonas arenae TaxID=676201 RepID=A0A5C5B9A3_9MICO|nr:MULTISPECIES: hypothetical protein [Miniimonas]TNU73478.1 hypothetical protein FH969_11165 [Miniimonas arenae]